MPIILITIRNTCLGKLKEPSFIIIYPDVIYTVYEINVGFNYYSVLIDI